MVYGLFLVISEVYFQIWYRYLTSGIRALSLAKEGKICFLFLRNCFFREEKEGGALQVQI
jgi:hypothetical protein